MEKLKKKLANFKDFAKYLYAHEKKGIEIAWKYNSEFIIRTILFFSVFFIGFWFYYFFMGDLFFGVVVYCLVMAIGFSFVILRMKKGA